MASIFTRIIQGEIPCHKIAENEKFIAFLDITPVAKGHTLVVPKMEVDYFFDMNVHLAQQHQTIDCTRQCCSCVQPCNCDTVERFNRRATPAVSNVVSKKKNRLD